MAAPAMNDPDPNLNLHINVDLSIQEVLLAASQHNVSRLRGLIRTFHASRNEDESAIGVLNPVNVKDPETGYTPLHAAIAACEREEGSGVEDKINGDATRAEFGRRSENEEEEDDDDDDELRPARDTVKFLLQEGAIWNDLDKN